MNQKKATVKRIPPTIRQQADEIVERFNQEVLSTRGNSRYAARFKWPYLFLDRQDWCNRKPSPICRLEWTGDMSVWNFAIYKYSKISYDPDEWLFPGYDHFDGTIEDAMNAGLDAYEL